MTFAQLTTKDIMRNRIDENDWVVMWKISS